MSLRVAASHDLAPALEAFAGELHNDHSLRVQFSFGLNDVLARRVQEGVTSPFDVFVSPEGSYVGRLVSVSRCEDVTRSFMGFVTLVVVTAPGLQRLESVADLRNTRYARIAVVDPNRSSFGRAARQSIASLNMERDLLPRFVVANSARDALDQVRRGAVHAAIVPRAIVTDGDCLAVPQDLHRPIEQVGVVCTRDPSRREAALRMLQYAREGSGKELLEAYGVMFP